jgi:hypothetical protein
LRLAGSKITVTDGPFTEAKEIVGGYAIFDVPKAHMIRVTKRFMALHKTHMPGWEGECEARWRRRVSPSRAASRARLKPRSNPRFVTATGDATPRKRRRIPKTETPRCDSC